MNMVRPNAMPNIIPKLPRTKNKVRMTTITPMNPLTQSVRTLSDRAAVNIMAPQNRLPR